MMYTMNCSQDSRCAPRTTTTIVTQSVSITPSGCPSPEPW